MSPGNGGTSDGTGKLIALAILLVAFSGLFIGFSGLFIGFKLVPLASLASDLSGKAKVPPPSRAHAPAPPSSAAPSSPSPRS